MRRLYLVTYDIADSKRLRLVFKIMREHGDHLQYSVFRCELSDREKFEMIGDLEEVIHHDKDQVLLIPLGRNETLRLLGNRIISWKNRLLWYKWPFGHCASWIFERCGDENSPGNHSKVDFIGLQEVCRMRLNLRSEGTRPLLENSVVGYCYLWVYKASDLHG